MSTTRRRRESKQQSNPTIYQEKKNSNPIIRNPLIGLKIKRKIISIYIGSGSMNQIQVQWLEVNYMN